MITSLIPIDESSDSMGEYGNLRMKYNEGEGNGLHSCHRWPGETRYSDLGWERSTGGLPSYLAMVRIYAIQAEIESSDALLARANVSRQNYQSRGLFRIFANSSHLYNITVMVQTVGEIKWKSW